MTDDGRFEFTAPLWLYPGQDGWHFLSLPREVSDEITDLTQGRRGGFGSVRVVVTVGATSWRTSIFPDREQGTYLLPVKRAVRSAEAVEAGDEVRVSLVVAGL